MAKKATYDNESISSLKGADRVRKRPGVIFGSDGFHGMAKRQTTSSMPRPWLSLTHKGRTAKWQKKQRHGKLTVRR